MLNKDFACLEVGSNVLPEICDRENEPEELAHFGSKLPDSERINWNKGYVDKEVSSTGTDLVELENIV